MAVLSNDEERDFLSALGARITHLRKARGITQSQLAGELNLSQQTVQSWEAGRRRIQISMLPKVARSLLISLEALLGETPRDAPRKRGPIPKWQQHIEAIECLPRAKQKLITKMLAAMLSQAQGKE